MAAETEAAPAPVPAPVLFKKRAAKTNVRKRPQTPPRATSDADSASGSDSDSGAGPTIKRRKKAGLALGGSSAPKPDTSYAPTQHAASTSATIAPSADATKSTTWYEDAAAATPASAPDPRAPKPRHTYTNASTSSNAPRAPVGPVKSSTVRTVTTTDFAPDVCKDYKQTGFCGFGDSCKFLHAREDYAAGWQLDREWEARSKKPAADVDPEKTKEDAALEAIPFACVLCRKPYTTPVVTRCGHYFCEACALARYRRNPTCGACGAGTDGVFNMARGLRRLLDKKRARVEARRAEARERGEEVSGDEEGGGDGDKKA